MLLLFSLSAMPGCVLLNWSGAWFSSETTSEASPSNNMLGKIPISRTAVALEIVFVERPVNDPLLGSLLWDEVDQIGSLPPEARSALSKAGFRVGRVGANPPQALQTLMGLSTDLAAHDEKRLVGRRVVLPSGAETETNTGLAHPKATIDIPMGEEVESKTFENVRGVFRLKAKQLQDGWARVEFLPELHHGKYVNRPVYFPGGWQYQTAQAIERLYRQKFSLDLNVGEMVVITSEPQSSGSLGEYFFHSPQFTGVVPGSHEGDDPTPLGIQRLLIVRLADLSTEKSLYAE